jgi:hypothetical protein
MSRIPYRVGAVNLLVNKDTDETFVLDNGYSSAVLSVAGRGMALAEYTQQKNFTQAGSRITGYQWQAREIQIEFTYEAKNNVRLYQFQDRLINFIRANRDETIALRHIRTDGTIRDIDVVFNWERAEFSRGNKGLIESLQALAANPFFYNPTLQSVAVDDVVSGGYGYPYGYPYGYNSGIAGKEITYPGNVITHPTLIVTGPFTEVTIYNNTVNKYINVLYPLTAGQTLTIDLTPGNITIEDNLGTNLFQYVSLGSELIYFGIYPDSRDVPDGLNDFSFDAVAYTNDTTLTVEYYERYLSL